MVLQNGWYIWVSAKHLKLVLPLIPIQILNWVANGLMLNTNFKGYIELEQETI
jgi:hypothetical protein